MKSYRLTVIIIFLLLPSCISFADNYVFAPFISRLKAVEDNSAIKLTWKDSGDAKGTYLIYRHTEKISRNNFSDAFLVSEVNTGVENYTDTAMAGTDFYYSVILKTAENKQYDIFIPYRNVTSYPVSISEIRKIDDNLTYITYLRVTEKEDSLYLTFRSSNPDRNAAVLRSHTPIFTTDDLKKSDLLSVISSGRESYSDFPVAGIPCYYTVVDAELLKSYNMDIIPFENTTLTPSEIKITDKVITVFKKSIPLRPEPLPAVNLDINIETGRKISSAYEKFFPEIKLGKNTENLVRNILENEPKPEKPEPVIINSEDFYSQRENIQLTVILSRYFFKEDWKNLELKLKDFIRNNRQNSLNKRASFYLGQCYFYQGNYNKSFMEFLTSSDSYYPESRKWMDNILQLKNDINLF